jgi:hypothetical protein
METIQQTFDKLPVSMVLATPGTGHAVKDDLGVGNSQSLLDL